MKRILMAGVLTAALFPAWACTIETGPAANTTNTAATNGAANSPARQSNAANAPAASTAGATDANAAPPAAGAAQDFTLVNATGVEIHKLYISPHDKDEWGEDILGRDTLPSGQSGEVKFNRNERAATWDLRVEDAQGEAIVWESLDLLEISKLTLHYEDGRAWADAE